MKKSEYTGWRNGRFMYWPAPALTGPVPGPYQSVLFDYDGPTRCWAHADHYYWTDEPDGHFHYQHCENDLGCGFGCLNDSQTDVGLCAHHYELIIGGS
jgi:hypothetical protein